MLSAQQATQQLTGSQAQIYESQTTSSALRIYATMLWTNVNKFNILPQRAKVILSEYNITIFSRYIT